MKRITILFTFLLLCGALKAQDYHYDASGNRIKRTIPVVAKSMVQEQLTTEIEIDSVKNETHLEKEILKVIIFPNPTDGVFTIDLPDLKLREKGIIKIFTLTGKLIYKNDITQKSNGIDITSQQAGLYIAHITIGDKTVIHRIIKK